MSKILACSAVLFLATIQPSVAEPVNPYMQWLAVRMVLDGPVTLDYKNVAVCHTSYESCFAGSFYFSPDRVNGIPVYKDLHYTSAAPWGVRLEAGGSPGTAVLWESLHPPFPQQTYEIGFEGSRELVPEQSKELIALYMVSSSLPPEQYITLTGNVTIVSVKSGQDLQILFPRDFAATAHVMAGAVAAGVDYRATVPSAKGMLGVFNAWQGGFVLDASVDSPEGHSHCQFYMYPGLICGQEWVMNGPPGNWTFNVLGRLHDPIPSDVWLLAWVDDTI